MQHKDIPDSELHEVKGASAASAGQLLVAQGNGTAEFETPEFTTTRFGWWAYNDTATTSSPIALTTIGTEYQLTNNGLGANTNITYGLPGVTNIFNTSTNYFDFSNLSVGDAVDIRVDISLTTSTANTVVELLLEAGIGATPYKLTFGRSYIKTAGTNSIIIPALMYIGSNLTKNNPARLLMKSDTTGATVVVNGWYVRAMTNG